MIIDYIIDWLVPISWLGNMRWKILDLVTSRSLVPKTRHNYTSIIYAPSTEIFLLENQPRKDPSLEVPKNNCTFREVSYKQIDERLYSYVNNTIKFSIFSSSPKLYYH